MGVAFINALPPPQILVMEEEGFVSTMSLSLPFDRVPSTAVLQLEMEEASAGGIRPLSRSPVRSGFSIVRSNLTQRVHLDTICISIVIVAAEAIQSLIASHTQ